MTAPRLTRRGEWLRDALLISLGIFWLPWLAAALGTLATR